MSGISKNGCVKSEKPRPPPVRIKHKSAGKKAAGGGEIKAVRAGRENKENRVSALDNR
ncbi:MAG: hypothetical protein ACOX89_10870 [Lutispora sp.]